MVHNDQTNGTPLECNKYIYDRNCNGTSRLKNTKCNSRSTLMDRENKWRKDKFYVELKINQMNDWEEVNKVNFRRKKMWKEKLIIDNINSEAQ
jgi:hypothetical protein